MVVCGFQFVLTLIDPIDMDKAEFQKLVETFPEKSIVVDWEDNILTMFCPGDVIFTDKALSAPILTDKVRVNFVIFT